ncbi:MAG: tRNA lysidine(34) synthetase TilS [Planctomycetota bacterium]
MLRDRASSRQAHQIEHELQRALQAVLPQGAPLLLGVSGGSDSMALLAAVLASASHPVQVAYVHHGLRQAADAEAAFVSEFCAQRRVPCRVLAAPPRAPADSPSETSSRRRRMAALHSAAQAVGAAWILLAHHRDDDDETVLLRQARGHHGARALAGIPAVRPLDEQVTLFRPLLCGPSSPGRSALREYRLSLGWPCVEDESNADLTVPRNRVRAALAPLLPSDGQLLFRVRRAARQQLSAQLLRAAACLEQGLHAEGRGSRLLWSACDLLAEADHPELLRLLGACLARRRRLDPRRTVVDQLLALQANPGARLSLPASPRPLESCSSRVGLHFPAEPLSSGPASARLAAALMSLPQYL